MSTGKMNNRKIDAAKHCFDLSKVRSDSHDSMNLQHDQI